jgi:hypothetical protein
MSNQLIKSLIFSKPLPGKLDDQHYAGVCVGHVNAKWKWYYQHRNAFLRMNFHDIHYPLSQTYNDSSSYGFSSSNVLASGPEGGYFGEWRVISMTLEIDDAAASMYRQGSIYYLISTEGSLSRDNVISHPRTRLIKNDKKTTFTMVSATPNDKLFIPSSSDPVVTPRFLYIVFEGLNTSHSTIFGNLRANYEFVLGKNLKHVVSPARITYSGNALKNAAKTVADNGGQVRAEEILNPANRRIKKKKRKTRKLGSLKKKRRTTTAKKNMTGDRISKALKTGKQVANKMYQVRDALKKVGQVAEAFGIEAPLPELLAIKDMPIKGNLSKTMKKKLRNTLNLVKNSRTLKGICCGQCDEDEIRKYCMGYFSKDAQYVGKPTLSPFSHFRNLRKKDKKSSFSTFKPERNQPQDPDFPPTTLGAIKPDPGSQTFHRFHNEKIEDIKVDYFTFDSTCFFTRKFFQNRSSEEQQELLKLFIDGVIKSNFLEKEVQESD